MMSPKAKSKPHVPALIINSEVLRRIRQHARSQSKTEVCGVLIGREHEGKLEIAASIAGASAAQAGTHVTFTQDTWEHIYKIKDKEYPEERIIGWYHSHPGFGVFLSDHDVFIHKNFFSSPQQVAWVYDPHNDEEGCFGWIAGRIERLSRIAVSDQKGGEAAGETGKPEPSGSDPDDEASAEKSHNHGLESQAGREPRWLEWTLSILSHVSIFALGLMVAWFFFPRVVLLPVDPRSGHIIQSLPEGPNTKPNVRDDKSRGAQSGEGRSDGSSAPAGNAGKGNNGQPQ